MIKYYKEMIDLTLDLNKLFEDDEKFFFKNNNKDRLVITKVKDNDFMEIDFYLFESRVLVNFTSYFHNTKQVLAVFNLINNKYPNYFVDMRFNKKKSCK